MNTKINQYVELLQKWNKVYNLTAIRDKDKIFSHHIADCLAVLPHLKSGRVLDVGTGAGLPGIPLAIMRPDMNFCLLDSRQKKINFVQHVITCLQLENVTAVCARVEEYSEAQPFATIISRAFASIPDYVKLIQHLVDKNTKIIAMKGRRELALKEMAPAGYSIDKVVELDVPGLNEERCLIFISKDGD